MEFLFELLFEIFAELLLQVVAEVLFEIGLRSLAAPFKKRPNPYLASIGYVLFGAVAGGLSLWVFPTLFIGSYRAAVLAKDVEAFMRLYHPTVRVFDAWGVWSYEGADAWRIAVEGWFASLGSEKVKVTFADVNSTVEAASAVVTAIVTYAGESAQGEPLRAMQNRITWVLR